MGARAGQAVMSWSEFLSMGGYAVYVWGSYALGLIVLLGNVWAARRRRRQVIDELARRQRREDQQ